MAEPSVPVVAILGASGFVGSAVAAALRPHARIVPVAAPRLRSDATTPAAVLAQARSHPETERLAGALAGCDAFVNAAGIADAAGADREALAGANALLACMAAVACRDAGVTRVVHVSSAAVQGDRTLDESEDMAPFSQYSWSKALGERAVAHASDGGAIRYRPTSVHGADRPMTRRLARLARSPWAVVAAPGTQPTPQVLAGNVGDAVRFLVLADQSPPGVVLHPWEGITTSRLLTVLGGREPRMVPLGLARATLGLGNAGGRLWRRARIDARRAELLMLGQVQGTSWLTLAGWVPPVGPAGWVTLGRQLAADLDAEAAEHGR
ncbi:MAG: NAD(P)-dependent oxidoreductase [Actinomycetota bacterium]|nr:NAD(P)-dependent oxidoreductase [Actinomycetota bacterium]